MDDIFAWDTATQYETILSGSSRRVCEQLDRLVSVSGCDYVICAFAWGDMPHQQSLRSLELFAQEVMPAFGAVGNKRS